MVSIRETKRGERKAYSRFDPNFYTPGTADTREDGSVVLTDNDAIRLSTLIEDTDAESGEREKVRVCNIHGYPGSNFAQFLSRY